MADLDPARDPVRVTKDLITQVLTCEAHLDERRGPRSMSTPLVRGVLVDALFRQWVTSGQVGDPLEDALAALMASGDHDVPAWVAGLDGDSRVALAQEVTGHLDRIQTGWPVLPPSWLARTQERLTVPLAGGLVILQGVIDLSLGSPSAGAASVCIVEVKSGRRRVEHRGDLQLYALMETLRSGAPPFRIATYYSATGELDVEPVRREVLHGALHRVVVAASRLCRLAAGAQASPTPNALCTWCAALPKCAEGQRQAGATEPRRLSSDDSEETDPVTVPWRDEDEGSWR